MARLPTSLRLALRSLARRPLHAAWLAVAVALGLGAATTVLAAVHAFLLHPLPFADADELVRIRSTRLAETIGLSYADYLDLSADVRSLESSAFFGDSWLANVDVGDGTLTFPGVIATGGFFDVLGAEAARGRTLRPADDDPRSPLVVVIGHHLWQGPLGGDPEILGTKLSIGRDAFEVVGVMPPGFSYPRDAELWIAGGRFFDRRRRGFRVDQAVGRLAVGATPAAAEAELAARAAELARLHPETNSDVGVAIVPEARIVAGDLRPTLHTLAFAVLLLYLVCVSNVSQWVLVRAAARRRELAIRRALGARRLVPLLAVETLVPVLLGALGGLGIAWAAAQYAPRLLPPSVPAWVELAPPPWLVALHLGFAVVLALAAAAVASPRPGRALPTLRTGGGSLGGRRRARRALVAAEIALTLALLVAAGLATRTLHSLLERDPGLDPTGVLTVGLNFSADLSDAEKATELERGVAAIRDLPAVRAAGVSSDLAWVGQESWDRHELRDADYALRGVANLQQIHGDLPAALGLPIVAGRALDARDFERDFEGDGGDHPVVVSRSLARALWGSPAAALDRRLALGPDSETPLWRRVVGVTGDVRHAGWTGDAGFDVYAPIRRDGGHVPKETHLAIRTEIDPASLGDTVRRTLAAAAPRLGVHDLRPLADHLRGSVRRERLWTALLGSFATIALVLSVGGLYGVIAASVSRRTREIGLRMAVGARRGDICRMVLGESARTLSAGLALGLGVAVVAVRGLEEAFTLHGLSPWSPTVWILVPAALATAALAAAWLPARRAARLDPQRALRRH